MQRGTSLFSDACLPFAHNFKVRKVRILGAETAQRRADLKQKAFRFSSRAPQKVRQPSPMPAPIPSR
jgi:hypothetical protein